MKKWNIFQLMVSLLAACLIFFGLVFGLKWNFVFSTVLAVGVYLGLWIFLTPRPDTFTLYVSKQPNGEELRRLMEEACHDLKQIRELTGQITDVQTHQSALGLTETGTRLYRYLWDHPEKIPSARRFLSYYLETVGKILGQYVKFQGSGLSTREVREFQHRVQNLLPKLNAGFEAQLTQVTASERFDVEADMKVIEGMIQTEGVTLECREKAD